MCGSVVRAHAHPFRPFDLPPSKEVRFYHTKAWRLDDGLPQNTVTSIVQGPQGYLWLGTLGGLVRFDGFRFEVWDPTTGLTAPRILSLNFGPDGALWLGHEHGSVSRFMPDSGHSRNISLPSRHEHTRAEFVGHRDGELWISGRGGVIRSNGKHWFDVAHGQDVRQAVRTRDGCTWVAGPKLLARTSTDGVSLDIVTRRLNIHRLSVDPDGRLWIAHRFGLDMVVDGRPEPRLRSERPFLEMTAPLFSQDGALWISIGSTLIRHPSFRSLAVSRNPEDNQKDLAFVPGPMATRTLFEDRERNLWVGTEGDGLWRVSLEPFTRVGRPEGMKDRSGGPIVSDNSGGLWAGSGCSGAAHFAYGKVIDYAFEGHCISALAFEEGGTLWAGALHLIARKPDGRERIHPVPKACREISALYPDKNGSLWAASEHGCLLRLENGQLERVPSPLRRRVNFIEAGPDGELWIGESSRVLRLKDGTWSELGTASGAPAGAVRAIHLDHDDVWLASYGGGLSLIRRGQVHRFDRSHGLQDNFISHILDDGRGYMWFNSNRGAFRVPKQDFDRVIDGLQEKLRARPLPTGEGEGGHPSGWFDGQHIHFPTRDGLVTIELERIWKRPPPLPTVIESAEIDGVELSQSSRHRAPPGRGRFEAHFTAPLLRWPHLASFEHRLEGFENEWRRTRQRSVSYENLGPGTYRFSVRAINEEERKGPPTRLRFSIQPRFYETLLVQSGTAVAAALLLFGGHRWRTRAMSRQNRRLEAEIRNRQMAERALGDREAHYRRVFESSVNGFILENSEGRIMDLNPTACTMFGGSREALLGRATHTLFDRTEPASHPDCIICLRVDGRRFEGKLTRRRMSSSDPSQVLLTINDLSPLLEARAQEQRLQAQLAHSQRVEAIGRLAGGVAHDVNNMLTVVQGQARLAQESLLEGDLSGVSESLHDILQSSERTGNITRQLLALGRRRQVQPTDVDVKSHLLDMRRMLERLTPDNVVLRWAWSDENCAIRIDRTQLEQLVVNLVINASQALPRGGTVEVGVARVRGQPAHLPTEALAGTEWVNLSIEDDGVGMSDQVRSRIFEPFFSTKPQGENTGLGLSVVHGIVADASGQYFVESTEGVGSRFDFLFPALGEGRKPDIQPIQGLAFGVGGDERILFCEDETPVRKTTARVLERAGYSVAVAAHPFDALERVRTSPKPFALLVTDVMMPDMNGRELAEAVRTLAPEMKVLYVSGYTSDIIYHIEPNQEFIEKPYEARDLLAAVRRMLDD